MAEPTDAEAREKVWKLIKDIRVALMVTHGAENGFHARPMSAVGKEFNGSLWFFTRAESVKLDEIMQNPQVLLSYSEPAKQEYISVQGKAEIVRDRAKIEELWSEFLRTWFPKGKEDPEIALIRVDVTQAEYWDSPSSAIVMLYGYTMARITGEIPKVGEHKKVGF